MAGVPRLRPAGDKALVVEFGDVIDEATNARVQRLHAALQGVQGIMETVPTYRSLLVYYDPLAISLSGLMQEVLRREEAVAPRQQPTPPVFRVPVVFGGKYGPDLPFVAAHSGLTEDEVVRLFTGALYRIYMLGFTPGFCYLGGLSRELAAPRLKKPRLLVPAGSVGIAGDQTGIYPIDSPGGWQLIGRTPLKLFNPVSSRPFLFAAGQYLRFFCVEEEEYLQIGRMVDSGEYLLEDEGASR